MGRKIKPAACKSEAIVMTDKEARQLMEGKESGTPQEVVMTRKEVCNWLAIKDSALARLERIAKLRPHPQGYTRAQAKQLAATLAAVLPGKKCAELP